MIREKTAAYASEDELYGLYWEGMGKPAKARVVIVEEQEQALLESPHRQPTSVAHAISRRT
jgi:hypothetical protein